MDAKIEVMPRHQIVDPDQMMKFILAGNAIFTLENQQTGVHITYKVRQPNEVEPNGNEKPHFVSYLSGPDNETAYSYLGTIFNKNNFRLTSKSPSSENKSTKGFIWLWKRLFNGQELPSEMHFYHEGRCGKCGKKLTDPESIRLGMGPTCRAVY